MSNTVLTRTVSGSDSTYTYKKNTVSVWLKRSQLGAACFFEGWYSNAFATQVYFLSSGELVLNAASSTSGSAFQIQTNRKFRDTSAWYHIVISIDTTDATSTDRCKIYVNGVRETSFASASYPNQNASVQWSGTGNTQFVGRRESGGAGLYYDGSMSYLAYIDGTAELPTIFGETDSVTGQWKIKTDITPSVAWGNFGFLILKDGNSLTDASPNSNNFTVASGTLTKTEDNPSNVFATMNPLIPGQTNYTYSHGNNTITQGSSAWVKSNSTLGMISGKYYWEAKYVSGLYTVVGVDKTDTATPYPSTSSSAVGWKRNGNVEVGTTPQTDIASYAHGDIVSVALDMDNACVYFGKGGVWQNSGDPTSGASKTGAYSLPSYVANTPYFATVSPYSSGATSMNFGNGSFGTTAVSSAGTNASGNGIFEYDVPTGFTALTTKGLNL